MNQRKNKNAAPFMKHRNEADNMNMESEGKQFVRPKYIFHLINNLRSVIIDALKHCLIQFCTIISTNTGCIHIT